MAICHSTALKDTDTWWLSEHDRRHYVELCTAACLEWDTEDGQFDWRKQWSTSTKCSVYQTVHWQGYRSLVWSGHLSKMELCSFPNLILALALALTPTLTITLCLYTLNKWPLGQANYPPLALVSHTVHCSGNVSCISAAQFSTGVVNQCSSRLTWGDFCL